jgi:hypothetical protein
MFNSANESHQHSRETLEILYEYDDFMGSINTLIDMGCGAGADLEWWATRTTRDEYPRPLNIKCTGVDVADQLPVAHQYPNIDYAKQDFEQPHIMHSYTYDVVWCHDSFQYVINPFQTLANWWDLMSRNSMLAIIVPQTTNLEFNKQVFIQRDGCYYNWTIVSLIHILAVSGFDCSSGFFLKKQSDHWLHAVVYKSEHKPMDPKTTSWYELAEKNLLPESAVESVNRRGFLVQQDLLLPWLDKSLMSFAQH